MQKKGRKILVDSLNKEEAQKYYNALIEGKEERIPKKDFNKLRKKLGFYKQKSTYWGKEQTKNEIKDLSNKINKLKNSENWAIRTQVKKMKKEKKEHQKWLKSGLSLSEPLSNKSIKNYGELYAEKLEELSPYELSKYFTKDDLNVMIKNMKKINSVHKDEISQRTAELLNDIAVKGKDYTKPILHTKKREPIIKSTYDRDWDDLRSKNRPSGKLKEKLQSYTMSQLREIGNHIYQKGRSKNELVDKIHNYIRGIHTVNLLGKEIDPLDRANLLGISDLDIDYEEKYKGRKAFTGTSKLGNKRPTKGFLEFVGNRLQKEADNIRRLEKEDGDMWASQVTGFTIDECKNLKELYPPKKTHAHGTTKKYVAKLYKKALKKDKSKMKDYYDWQKVSEGSPIWQSPLEPTTFSIREKHEKVSGNSKENQKQNWRKTIGYGYKAQRLIAHADSVSKNPFLAIVSLHKVYDPDLNLDAYLKGRTSKKPSFSGDYNEIERTIEKTRKSLKELRDTYARIPLTDKKLINKIASQIAVRMENIKHLNEMEENPESFAKLLEAYVNRTPRKTQPSKKVTVLQQTYKNETGKSPFKLATVMRKSKNKYGGFYEKKRTSLVETEDYKEWEKKHKSKKKLNETKEKRTNPFFERYPPTYEQKKAFQDRYDEKLKTDHLNAGTKVIDYPTQYNINQYEKALDNIAEEATKHGAVMKKNWKEYMFKKDFLGQIPRTPPKDMIKVAKKYYEEIVVPKYVGMDKEGVKALVKETFGIKTKTKNEALEVLEKELKNKKEV